MFDVIFPPSCVKAFVRHAEREAQLIENVHDALESELRAHDVLTKAGAYLANADTHARLAAIADPRKQAPLQ